jgi:hypothetical protein
LQVLSEVKPGKVREIPECGNRAQPLVARGGLTLLWMSPRCPLDDRRCRSQARPWT